MKLYSMLNLIMALLFLISEDQTLVTMIQIFPQLKLLYHKLKRLLVKSLVKLNQPVQEVSQLPRLMPNQIKFKKNHMLKFLLNQLLRLKLKSILSPTQSVHHLAALSICIPRQKVKTEDQNTPSLLPTLMEFIQTFKEPLLQLKRHTNTIGSSELLNQEP